MKLNLFLSFLLLTLLAFSIISGCGGDNNGITQPSSITTPTVNPSGSGYLVMDVVWPEEEAASGKCIISSGKNDKDIIASVPRGSIKVVFSVYEYDESKEDYLGDVIIKGNPYAEDPLKDPATILYPATRIILALPAVKVLVKAESWGFNFNSLQLYSLGYKISDPVQIQPGMNEVELDLGKQGFTLKAIPPEITLHEELSSSIIAIETPVPLIGETQIIARLVVESPDITEATPTQFVPKEDSNANNTLESQGLAGLENFEVKFKIIDGDGTLYPIDSQISQETVSAYTASDGYCNAILKATQPGNIIVQASCELIPGDPNSIVTRECYVTAIQPPPTPTTEHDNIFQSVSADPVGVNEKATITACIVDNIYDVWPPAPNVTVTFRISKDGVLLSEQAANTGNDGKCDITFTPAEIGMYDIEAKFENDDGTYKTTGTSLDAGDYKIWLHARYFGEWIEEYMPDDKWALTYITRGTQWYDHGIINGVDLDCQVYLQTNSSGKLFIEDQEVHFSIAQSSTSDNCIQITSQNIEPASVKTDSSGYCHAFYTASAIGLNGWYHTGTYICWRATASTKSGKVASITINDVDDIIECNNKKLFIEESVR